MKLAILLMTAACLQLHATGVAQQITLSGRELPARQVFNEIEKQTGYVVFATKNAMAAMKPVTVAAKQMPLKDFLQQVFRGQPLNFLVKGQTIVLVPKTSPPPAPVQTLPEAPRFMTIRGMIRDTTGQELVGASVRVKGTTKGTVTDAKGLFSIEANRGDILEVSFIGYEPKEIKITNGNLLYIILHHSHSLLDETQVIAYGTTTRRLSTGNITTIKAAEIAKNPVVNVLSALQGRVPGMFIQQMSGQPGYPYEVTIRGRSSLAASTQPLYVVDGVPYPNGKLPFIYPGSEVGGFNNNLQGGNVLDYLPPAMIESIDVLTDADATAIYGSRGGYGVVLITTKKGKAGKPMLNISAQTGVTVRGRSPELLSLQDYLMIRREALKNDGVEPGSTDFDVNGTWPEDRYTDWQKFAAGSNSQTTMLNATYSGGTGSVNYLVGGNYNVLQSVQRNTGANKTGGMNFNINTTTPGKKVFASLSGSFSSTVNNLLPIDFTGGALQAPNAPPVFNPDGSINWEPSRSNAKFAAFKMINRNQTNNLVFTGDFKYMPLKGLTLRATIGYNNISGRQNIGYPSTFFDPSTHQPTKAELNLYTSRVWNIDPNISYQVNLGSRGRLSATTGMTLVDRLEYSQNTTGTDFLSDDLLYNPTFTSANNITTTYNQVPGRTLSYFGILHYDWDNKYIINLNGRYDGSTKFGPRNRYGKFGSVGAAWIFSSESWFSSLLPVIGFAKLRGSIGVSGGDAINDYAYLNTYSSYTSYMNGVSLIPNLLANPDLHWESMLKREIALSLQLFKGRLGIDATYYNNRSSNQLVNQPLATVTGTNSIPANWPAVISNTGYELTLNTTNIQRKNFSWRSTFIISANRNILKSYPESQIPTSENYVLGKSTQGIKLFDYAGVDPETGYYTFYKNGEKGMWNFLSGGALDKLKDKTAFRDLAPKYFGSLVNSFTYKTVTLSFVFTYTSRTGKNFLGSQNLPFGIFNINPSSVVLKRWQKPGDIAPVQRVSQALTAALQQNNFNFSTGAYEDATYARLSNLNINYTLPPRWFHNRISNLSIFMSGQNLLTISKYKDLDPENLGAGLAPLRTFSAGFNVNL
ncbi:MAG TPA: SusC/RagA family TonB-linked outer membrane protein [Chitinophaga sp.]|uniref:SusC/RagA family TonB-linked outer membrane protein n=1 Tax=Chitinophaga sp. TaxID=1869181 RepID=UPI002DB5F42E|nr:SusC/RagA family TonB-linked outer membrane protein [Chitinophaga sp.]HEU4553877.1 SusC/RagA family TonB-linked outer membrane protein [Chitinophaga sp.]